MTNQTIKTNEEDLEIVIFGKGYGESILVHIFNNKYILLDSFIDPLSKKPIAIKYLEDNGLTVNNIVGIICTHWDTDHIRGIADIIEQSENKLMVYTPLVFSQKEIIEYITFLTNSNDTSITEFNKILNYGKNGKINLKYASADKNLFVKECKQNSIVALSPTDNQVDEYIKKLILPKKGDIKNTISPERNELSLVVYINAIIDSVLLGADMENSNIGGWDEIANNFAYKKCHLYKIPHHGSVTGHNDKVWENLVDKPISIITRFNPKQLPTNEMINKIKNLSSKTYIVGGQAKKDKKLTTAIRHTNSYNSSVFSIVDSSVGYVRCLKRRNENKWEIYSFGHVEEYNSN